MQIQKMCLMDRVQEVRARLLQNHAINADKYQDEFRALFA